MQARTRYIDMHCHLDLYPDRQTVVNQTEQQGIYTISVTNSPSAFDAARLFLAGHRYVRVAVGLHPQLAVERVSEIDRLWPLFEETRYVGEVGLDYSRAANSDRETQKRVFSLVLEKCSHYSDKIISIHSRRAVVDVLATVGTGYPGTIILHWFTGNGIQLNKAVGCGAYFSVNPSMVATGRGRAAVTAMPPERVLTESDGPFVQTQGRPTRPSDVAGVVTALARIWGLCDDEAKAKVFANFRGIIEQCRQAGTKKTLVLPQILPVDIAGTVE